MLAVPTVMPHLLPLYRPLILLSIQSLIILTTLQLEHFNFCSRRRGRILPHVCGVTACLLPGLALVATRLISDPRFRGDPICPYTDNAAKVFEPLPLFEEREAIAAMNQTPRGNFGVEVRLDQNLVGFVNPQNNHDGHGPRIQVADFVMRYNASQTTHYQYSSNPVRISGGDITWENTPSSPWGAAKVQLAVRTYGTKFPHPLGPLWAPWRISVSVPGLIEILRANTVEVAKILADAPNTPGLGCRAGRQDRLRTLRKESSVSHCVPVD